MEENIEVTKEAITDIPEDSEEFNLADTLIKYLYAIMNEEDIEAYKDKTKEEMTDIVTLCNSRYPERNMASYDPAYALFGQVLMNGYNTFGVDFFTQLLKRNDEVPKLCYKGLIDIMNNLMIENDTLALQILKLTDEDKYKEALEMFKKENDLTDEEVLKMYQTNNEAK